MTEKVSLTINGTAVEAEQGRLLIDVAEELGVFVPRFCYHPGMKSVAVCRMCLVKVEGQPKLAPACATPVADGLVVDTVDPDAVDAQKGMLEFLLINHPLDCPICDRAGECPLQDQTYAHGPGSSRYVEPKRTYEKALEISDLVVLDRERCVLCWRCVRFADEVAGDRFIQLVDRGPGTQILTFSDEPFDSYFSGNTIQICPVGALTGRPYRFVSRPWDLETAPSVCTYCAVGCPITNEARNDKMVRCQALPNEQVNDFWNCDKGRFGFHHVDAEDRLATPLLRNDAQEFEPTTWSTALDAIATAVKDKKVGVIAGGHLTTEDAFAIGRLASKVLKTNDIDARIQDAGAPYERLLEVAPVAGSTARINDLETAGTIVWIGPDPKETLPVLYLRLRQAVLEHGARLVVVSPRRISLDSFANEIVRDATDLSEIDSASPAVVCWGPSAAGRADEGLDVALDLARKHDAKVLMCPPHAGSQGLIDMGVHPSLGAGYVPREEAGRDTRGMLAAAAAGELDALLIFGADLIADFPDAGLAKRALEKCSFTVVMELFPTETVTHADVVLPSAAYAEREGTFTNLERRIQKLEACLEPPGTAREVWQACAGIARALGDEWGWGGFADIWKAIRSDVPTHSGVDVAALHSEVLAPMPHDQSGFAGDISHGSSVVAGPGGTYPKGFRQGAPFQTGQNWPLSWELRAFEARERPGVVPPIPEEGPAVGQRDPTDGAERPDAPEEASAGGVGAGAAPSEDRDEGAAAREDADSSQTFKLLTGRLIYDEGAMVSKSTFLRKLQATPFVEINDEDAKELSIADGDEVVVAANGTEARVKAVVADIVRGSVFVPYDQTGLRANTLISGPDPRVTVTPA